MPRVGAQPTSPALATDGDRVHVGVHSRPSAVRWHVIGYALWFTWVAALGVTLHRLGRDGRRRLALPLILGAMVWLAGEIVLLTRPLRWEWILGLRLAWSALGGLACALLLGRAPDATPLHDRLRAVTRTLASSRKDVLGCGVLFYLAILGDVVLVSTIWRAIDPASRLILTSQTLLWAAPGFVLGVFFSVVWNGRGVSQSRAVGHLLVGTHLLLLGMVAVLALAAWVSSLAEPPEPFELVRDVAAQVWFALATIAVTTVGLAAYISCAPTGRRALARTLLSLALFAASVLQFSLDQVPGLWSRAAALRDERAADPSEQRRAIGAWGRYLTAFPETDERAATLWRIATSHARLGDHAAARAAHATLGELPPDVPGQRYARWSRLALAAAPVAGARSDVASAPAIPPADYLNPAWRSVLGLLASGPSIETEQLLVGLRKVSLAADRLVLPPLTNLFEAKAYARLLGVVVDIAPLTVADIRTRLAGGSAVLVEARGRWLCLVGVEPRWGTFLYLDYDRETDAIRRRERRAQARALTADGTGTTARTRLREEILDEIPEAEVAQMLADRQQLAATLASGPRADAAAASWDGFLVGELAMEAGDPVAALEHYARTVEGRADWLLPFVYVAARAAERPPQEIVEQRIRMRPDREAFDGWQAVPAHAKLLRRATAAFEQAATVDVPTPVLERLGKLLDPRKPGDAALRVQVYETLSARHPEEAAFLTALTESHLVTGERTKLATTYRRLAALEWGTETHRLHLADTLLRLDRAAEAREELRRVRERTVAAGSAPLLALEGRTALALGEHERAVRLLEDALESHPSDPETRAALALALEASGQAGDARREWQWVDWTGIDPQQLAVARARLGRTAGAPVVSR